MKTPRLTISNSHTILVLIQDNLEEFQTLSTTEAIEFISKETGIELSENQLKNIAADAGLRFDTKRDLTFYAITAIAARMKWQMSTLLSEGRALVEKRTPVKDDSKPLKLPINERQSLPANGIQVESEAQDQAPEGQDAQQD